jgi:hypothetical protein
MQQITLMYALSMMTLVVHSLVNPISTSFKSYYLTMNPNFSNQQPLKILHVGAGTPSIGACDLTCIAEPFDMSSCNDEAFDIVSVTEVLHDMTLDSQQNVLLETARVLRFDGVLCVVDEPMDLSSWTRSGSKRLAAAGFVAVREEHTPEYSMMMASRSRFAPILSMTIPPEGRPQAAPVSVGKSNTRKYMLLLADIPTLMLQLLLLYTIFRIIVTWP